MQPGDDSKAAIAQPLANTSATVSGPLAQSAAFPSPPGAQNLEYQPNVVAGAPAMPLPTAPFLPPGTSASHMQVPAQMLAQPPLAGFQLQCQEMSGDRGCQKKTRLVWTAELHTRFLFAVEQIGLRTAVPRTILQVMGVEGLTRENIASHLQKYRRLLEKKAGISGSGPASAHDWPRLEAAQTAHLEQVRRQVVEEQGRGRGEGGDMGADMCGGMMGVDTAALPGGVQGGHAQQSGGRGGGVLAHDGDPLRHAEQPLAPPQPRPFEAAAATPRVHMASMAPPQVPRHHPPPALLQQPGICPVTPQMPPNVTVPGVSGSDGHAVGVPVAKPIMPPLMCVLPQADGSPILLPMLPAMYMASCGKNTPEFMGRVPLQQGQVAGLQAGMPPMQGFQAEGVPMHAGGAFGSDAHASPMLPAVGGGAAGSSGLGGPMFPGFVPPAGPIMFPPQSDACMPIGAAPQPWPRPRAGGLGSQQRLGSAMMSTLPPLATEAAGGHRGTIAASTGGGSGLNGSGVRSSRSKKRSAGSSGRRRDGSGGSKGAGDLDKGDKPWTPRKPNITSSGRITTRGAVRNRAAAAAEGDAPGAGGLVCSTQRLADIKLEGGGARPVKQEESQPIGEGWPMGDEEDEKAAAMEDVGGSRQDDFPLGS